MHKNIISQCLGSHLTRSAPGSWRPLKVLRDGLPVLVCLSLFLLLRVSVGGYLPTCLESNREVFFAIGYKNRGKERSKGPQVVGKVGESVLL